MNCKRVTEVLFLFFDNEMEKDLLTPFQKHLSGCGHCAQRMDYTRKLLLLVRHRIIRQTAPPRLRQRILTKLPHRSDRQSEARPQS